MTLLDEVMATYGGLERWQQVDTIEIHQIVGGLLWSLKGVDGVINDSTVKVRVNEQHVSHRPLPRPGLRSSFSPDRVTIETDEDEPDTVETLTNPRQSFAGHTLESPWSMLQLAYFGGYAMWTYLSEPYSLTFAGVQTEELGAWKENGQTWRRLGVHYPASIATHTADQVLYIDSDGLVRRRDYTVDIIADSAAAHYSDDHRQFDGVILPVKRTVHARNEDGDPIREMVSVTIDIDDVRVS